jgi:hypothetical protein
MSVFYCQDILFYKPLNLLEIPVLHHFDNEWFIISIS